MDDTDIRRSRQRPEIAQAWRRGGVGPFLKWAVRAIEQRLELGVGLVQRHMLAAFRERTAHSHNPVMVFGDDLTLANSAATDRFDGPAQLVLREVAREAAHGAAVWAERPSGAEVRLRCTRVAGTAGAAVVEVLPGEPSRPRAGTPRRVRNRGPDQWGGRSP